MTSKQQLLNSIQLSPDGISLSQWLLEHPDVARRSAQRWLTQFIEEGLIRPSGEGRARCYKPLLIPSQANITENGYSDFIPLSEDSRDILSYIDQTIEARSPVGYQYDFLDSSIPSPNSKCRVDKCLILVDALPLIHPTNRGWRRYCTQDTLKIDGKK